MKSERTYIFCNSFLAKITEILMHYNFLEYIIKLCNFVTILVSLNIEINLRTSSLFTNMISYSKKIAAEISKFYSTNLSTNQNTELLCDWSKNDRILQMQTSSVLMFVSKEVRKVRSCSKKKNNFLCNQ